MVLHQGRVIGVCAIGDWEESRRVQSVAGVKIGRYDSTAVFRLNSLLGEKSQLANVSGVLAIATVSLLAVLAAALFVLLPGIEPVDSVQKPSYEFLWTDGFWKQVSGFTILALVALGLMMTLRKRIGWTFLGDFSYWRIVHVLLGLSALGVLLMHTGAHLGDNLNRLLILETSVGH